MNTILIGTPKIINSLGIKEKKIVHAPGELSIEIYNDKKIGKNNNVIIFNADQNLVKTRVGLKWIYNKFPNINDIINIAEIVPINEMILKNHILIPKRILSLCDSPIEWNLEIKIPSILIHQSSQDALRNTIYENNLDFIYGDVLSINQLHNNARIMNELKNYNICDGLNNLAYIVNEFAEINKISIFNFFIGSPSKYILNKKLNINLIIKCLLNKIYQ